MAISVPDSSSPSYLRADDSWIFRLENGDGHGGWQLFAEYTVRRVESRGR
jgi:hypothetical protein